YKYFINLPHKLVADEIECRNDNNKFHSRVSYKRFISFKNYVKSFLNKELEWEEIETKGEFLDDQNGGYNVTHKGIFKLNKRAFNYDEFSEGEKILFTYAVLFFLLEQNQKLNIKESILIIDEPELHMHPALQERLVAFILKISVDSQIFMSTHSSLLIKQLSQNDKVKIMILNRDNRPLSLEERKLPYLSSNETNFLAFALATEEYHNELYEYLKSRHGEQQTYKAFDNTFFVQEKKEPKSSPWMGHPNEVSIHTFLRNQIHHSADNGKPNMEDLKISITKMRAFFDI
ncbi:MAG: ATP-binding protein, partial [Synergistaceae bacterium]|nr:ATP-binding protein [Synergistaceae bacterium]